MNKNESKYFNTAVLMDEAFLYLLEKKEYEFISVKEICKKAGVSRSTFYLHYESVDDLLSETIEYINKKFLESFDKESLNVKIDNDKDELNFIQPKYLIPYLNFVKENKRIFELGLKKPNLMQSKSILEKWYKNLFLPIMDSYGIETKFKPYMMVYYCKGIIAIIEYWVTNECKESIDNIVDIIMYTTRMNEKNK